MRDVARFLRKGNLEIKPYAVHLPVEELQARLGTSKLALMALNENLMGPSPKAVAAVEREARNANLYPDGPCTVLRSEMAKTLGIDPDMITITNGADNALLLVAGAFINEGDEVMMGDPSFIVYPNVVKIMGGVPVYVPLKDYVHDLESMERAFTGKTKLVFVCNPNNPTGTIVRKQDLDGFVSRLPENTILVLDEAYFDFVVDKDYPDGLDYVREGFNVICLRTFSKVSGLAGLRVGYAIGCREFIGALNRVREAFPVSRLAQAAALAAWGDHEFRQAVREGIENGKAYLYREFERMGLSYVPSQTNFVFVDVGRDSQQIAARLRQKGILIATGGQWRLPNFIRVTIGTMEGNRRLIGALESALNTSDG
ncbi:MAG: histidinol-phosphate transaminase [Deltaproteobacteria bacterium]|nr:histidinol-phosphate transaminase [Deltaproteobacteria bacterium]